MGILKPSRLRGMHFKYHKKKVSQKFSFSLFYLHVILHLNRFLAKANLLEFFLFSFFLITVNGEKFVVYRALTRYHMRFGFSPLF